MTSLKKETKLFSIRSTVDTVYRVSVKTAINMNNKVKYEVLCIEVTSVKEISTCIMFARSMINN